MSFGIGPNKGETGTKQGRLQIKRLQKKIMQKHITDCCKVMVAAPQIKFKGVMKCIVLLF